MNYGSVCSGIESATTAWAPLGWEAQWFSEIEKFPSAVLAHHYPDVPNLGDMTKMMERREFHDRPIDLLVGGTPCQSFSVAGLRKGLDDPRGNLALVFLSILGRSRARWMVWENVPGVLSSSAGKDFAAFLGGLTGREITPPSEGWQNSGVIPQNGPGNFGIAWRVLDAQYFGLAQRRKRVFVVGYLGDWRPAAAVLFERESLSGNPPPSREKGKGTTLCIKKSVGGLCARTGLSRSVQDADQGHLIATERTGESRGQDPVIAFEQRSQDGVPRVHGEVCPTLNRMGGGQREPCVAIPDVDGCLQERDVKGSDSDTKPGHLIPVHIAPTLTASNDPSRSPQSSEVTKQVESVFMASMTVDLYNGKVSEKTFATLGADSCQGSHAGPSLLSDMAVRRLTPRECERLQGFPDDYTLIPWRGKQSPDGPRYKALGNSMAKNVMRWIGQRIQMVDEILKELK